jgi:pheromone shutdown protein TraB
MMARIVLVPTSHIARESLDKVRGAVKREKPDCIAVELDRGRYNAMKMEKQASALKMLKQLGPTTWLVYIVFRKIQKSMGKRINVFPGQEMMGAVDIASEKHIKVAFIDRDVRTTFMNIKEVGRGEKLKLFWFIFKGLSIGWIYQKIKGKSLVDVSKMPSEKLVEQAMSHLKKHFPNIYKALVSDRDRHMSENLKVLSKDHKKIVAVIGAGHKKGMEKILRTSRPRSRPKPSRLS